MKTIIVLMLACALAAGAQTLSTNVSLVTLSGDVHNPIITNHSGKPVIAAMVIRQLADGTHTVSQRLFTHSANEFPDGASVKYGEYSRHESSPELSARITAVIFSDGEFRGEDSYEFQTSVERHLQVMREVWQIAKVGNWKGLQDKADHATEPGSDTFGSILAIRLLDSRGKNGHAKTIDSFSYVGNFPASTWKGGLLNILKIPEAYQAIVGWFIPMVAYAYPNYGTVQPWPQDGSTDDYHPTAYNYRCNSSLSNPCPGVGQDTPQEGISAYCTDGYGYYIAASATLSNDDYNYPTFTINGTQEVTNNKLKVWGVCNDNLTGNFESFSYAKQCTGIGDPHPVLEYDYTGTVCGASASGYPN